MNSGFETSVGRRMMADATTLPLREMKWLLGGLHILKESQRLKSIALAAAALQITPVAARNHLHALEQRVGRDVFVRRSEQFVITPQGAELLARHANLLGALRGLQLQDLATKNSIRICCLFTVMQAMLIPEMQRISQRFPNVALTCSSKIEDIAGDFDVVIQRSADKMILNRAAAIFPEPLLLLDFTESGTPSNEIALEGRHAHLVPQLPQRRLDIKALNDPIVVLDLARTQKIACLCRLYIGAEIVARTPDCFVSVIENEDERLGVWASGARSEKAAYIIQTLRRQIDRLRRSIPKKVV